MLATSMSVMLAASAVFLDLSKHDYPYYPAYFQLIEIVLLFSLLLVQVMGFFVISRTTSISWIHVLGVNVSMILFILMVEYMTGFGFFYFVLPSLWGRFG
tara:strand:+ start:2100 stop:2399 length:300 start_codon:yes stop_codon:yes gene_type:complete